MHFKNGIKILQLFCTLKKIEFYEIIDPIWNNTGIIYGISEKEAVGTKERNWEENNTTRKKKCNVLKTEKKRPSNVENPDRIEDRVVKSHTKIRSHEELST